MRTLCREHRKFREEKHETLLLFVIHVTAVARVRQILHNQEHHNSGKRMQEFSKHIFLPRDGQDVISSITGNPSPPPLNYTNNKIMVVLHL